MTVFDLPSLQVEEFLGVDFSTDAERLPLGALVYADGVRVDKDGNLRAWGSLDDLLTHASDTPLAIEHYEANDELTMVGVSAATATVWDVPRAVGSATSRGTFTVTSGIDIASLVNMYERVFVQVYKEALHYLDNTTVTKLASSDTDLDEDADSTDELKFTSIVEYGGHLIGFGFGDETGSGTMVTGDLGPDRPELARWSNIGQPLIWTPQDWQIIGTRGRPVLQGVVAFGRCACLKPEGVFLLYGDLENGFSQVEELHVERGLASGGVSPTGACYYDGALYWQSLSGPMRWTGNRTAEYIGKAVEGDMDATFRNYASCVVPVPQLDAVLFTGWNDPSPPSGSFPGGPTVSPGQQVMDGWLWDTKRERWIGKVKFGGSLQRLFALVPDENGERRVLTHTPGNDAITEFVAAYDQNQPMGGDDWIVRTGVAPINGGKWGVVRGLVLEGDWVNMSGEFELVVWVDGASAKQRKLFVAGSSPTANQAGDLWYDTASKYALEWSGSAWVRQPGVPEGVVRMHMNQKGRTAQVRITVSNQTGGIGSVIRSLDLQVTPE